MLDEEAACSLYANETWIGKHFAGTCVYRVLGSGKFVESWKFKYAKLSVTRNIHHIVFVGRLLILLYESFILAATVVDWFNLINATNL